jgi:DNA (cytosine-5)-methyltransferase 1
MIFDNKKYERSASKNYYAFLKKYFSSDYTKFSKLIGRFYTNEFIYTELVEAMLTHFITGQEVKIIDPFCGDGRLVRHFISEFLKSNKSNITQKVIVSLWDVDESIIKNARRNILSLVKEYPELSIIINTNIGDTFAEAISKNEKYDVCITNPPWCILKPILSNMKSLNSPLIVSEYEQVTEKYGKLLQQIYSHSIPAKRFGRWGINLSRCGVECALRLLGGKGICGIVMPASFFSDQVSELLRKWMFENFDVEEITYYPAELKLFGAVDQSSATVVLCNNNKKTEEFTSTVFNRHKNRSTNILDGASLNFMRATQYAVPFGYDEKHFSIAMRLLNFDKLSAYPRLKIGRELDETRIESKLANVGKLKFIKGFMVERYSCMKEPLRYLKEGMCDVPESVIYERIAWRDVSRSSQKRRLQATILSAGTVTGNSLGVVYIPDATHEQLCFMLAVMNSYIFEFQAKRQLVTNHVPSGVLKNIPIPPMRVSNVAKIAPLVDMVMAANRNRNDIECKIECLVGIAYGLSLDEFLHIVSTFSLLPEETETLRETATKIWNTNVVSQTCEKKENTVIIPNHYAPKLSDLDKIIISHIPQGGNWKNIPESVPSQRLVQIRESFKAGKGSRSTYYGRLRDDMPAYTISTYFPRPGNGCNIHYEQERTLTQREAARLQSFPDSFVFKGSLTAINDQIGNAVPPLLAYQLARALPIKGQFVDLFCGAGGLSLGFAWAGWTPVIGNDINLNALETHKTNIREEIICGDITFSEVIDSIIERCQNAIKTHPQKPLYIIGGPPCQGFSTANRFKNMNDQRNWLFKAYSEVLKRVKPQGFLFENVTGILNFECGQFFEMIKKDLGKNVELIKTFKFNCAEYGIPQRRERIIVIGSSQKILGTFSLPPITTIPKAESMQKMFDTGERRLPNVVNVKEALSDLPIVVSGEDGSRKPYRLEPIGLYQFFVRGQITAKEYIDALIT